MQCHRMSVKVLVRIFMFLSCFEKLHFFFFRKISFLQTFVHGQFGTKIATVLTVFVEFRVLHTFKPLTTR